MQQDSETIQDVDDAERNRSVQMPDALWERVGRAAEAESRRLGLRVTRSDIVRQGAALRADQALAAVEEESP